MRAGERERKRDEVVAKYRTIYELSPEKSLAWCIARDVSGSAGDIVLLRAVQQRFCEARQDAPFAADSEWGTYSAYCSRRIAGIEAAIQEFDA